MTFVAPTSEIPWLKRNFPDCDWAGDVLEFYGPATNTILGVKYKTLTHGGFKFEGDEIPGPLIWSEAEAWHLFKRQLAQIACETSQIAWRCPPMAEQAPEGNWTVRARLRWAPAHWEKEEQ